MTKITVVGWTTLAVIGLLLVIAFQRRELTSLRERNAALEGEIQDRQNVGEPTEPLSSSKGNPEESSQLRTANLEVQRLRGEVNLLRTEISVLKGEIAEAAQTDEERKAKSAQENYTRLRNTYDNLSSLSRADLRKALVSDVFPDEQMERYERDLTKAEELYSKVSADFGPNHPEVLRVAGIVSDTEQKIDAYLDEVLPGLLLLSRG